MNEVILPDELTPQDRMKAFREDLAALNELAVTVHKKAVDGDNAAGHLDLKIRERKAAMFGYDSPQRFDMVMVSELNRPNSTEVLERAFDALVAQGQIDDETKGSDPSGRWLPAGTRGGT